MTKTLFEQLISDPENLRLFQQEYLITEVTELICKVMTEKNVRRSNLADKLHLTKGRISQILNGEANLKLRTVADIFTVLGKEMSVSAQDLFKEEMPVLNTEMIMDEYKLPKLSWQFKVTLPETSPSEALLLDTNDAQTSLAA